MAYIKVYDKKIKCRGSLKECVEFHFNDDDLCKENGKKMIFQYYLDRSGRCHEANLYSKLSGERGKWDKEKTAEYIYFIISWDKDQIWPEEAMDLSKTFHEEYLYDIPTLISIHEDEYAVHAHFLVRMIDSYGERIELKNKDLFTMENNYYGHEMVLADQVKLPYEFRTYFDAMRYLMY